MEYSYTSLQPINVGDANGIQVKIAKLHCHIVLLHSEKLAMPDTYRLADVQGTKQEAGEEKLDKN